jgi:hypothetical protein
MKLFAFASIFLSISTLFAGNITVNNNTPSPGQYSDLQIALNAANIGDTVLIHRSPNAYGNVIVTKRLTIIGEGAMPDKNPANGVTVGTMTLTYDPATLTNASKSKISGLSMTTLFIYEKSTDVNFACDTVTVNYCRISSITMKNKVYGFTLTNSMVNLISGGIIFNNKYFNNLIQAVNLPSGLSLNNIFANNIIFNQLAFYDGIVANNIIYYRGNTSFAMGCYNVKFTNNIMYAPLVTFTNTPYTANGNQSINNKLNVSPLFVYPLDFSTVLAYTYAAPAAGPFADFNTQAGSQAINAGTDGTNIGIYGGQYPWRDGSATDSRFRYYPIPNSNPVIKGLTINNMVVNPGGTLQVQINATTQP